jgi:hypothetical protein
MHGKFLNTDAYQVTTVISTIMTYERSSDLLPEIVPITSTFLFRHETPWIAQSV